MTGVFAGSGLRKWAAACVSLERRVSSLGGPTIYFRLSFGFSYRPEKRGPKTPLGLGFEKMGSPPVRFLAILLAEAFALPG